MSLGPTSNQRTRRHTRARLHHHATPHDHSSLLLYMHTYNPPYHSTLQFTLPNHGPWAAAPTAAPPPSATAGWGSAAPSTRSTAPPPHRNGSCPSTPALHGTAAARTAGDRPSLPSSLSSTRACGTAGPCAARCGPMPGRTAGGASLRTVAPTAHHHRSPARPGRGRLWCVCV